MKKYISGFILKGMVACGFGPMVLAVIYLVLQKQEVIQTLTVNQVCLGIFSLEFLAFIVGGANILYEIEKLPLVFAILIHGNILYISYLGVYLINDWLKWGAIPFFTFTCIFLFAYLMIGAIIYVVTIKRTTRINEVLKRKHQDETQCH